MDLHDSQRAADTDWIRVQVNRVPLDTRAKYLLSDWDIEVRYEAEHDENLGDADVRAEWREAVIRIFNTEIVEGLRHWPSRTEQRILEHELCEVAVADEARGLPEHITTNPEFEEFCDRMAERLRRCVEKAGE